MMSDRNRGAEDSSLKGSSLPSILLKRDIPLKNEERGASLESERKDSNYEIGGKRLKSRINYTI